MGWRWNGQGLRVSRASFPRQCTIRPISHAGQIYRFLANDAFRVGMEGGLGTTRNGMLGP